MSRLRKVLRFWILPVCVVLVTAATASALLGMGRYQKVKAVNGVVSIPVIAVNDGKAHFYKFTAEGKEIAFFLVKSSDGAIRSAFDACDVCYREKKGYEQQGGDMVCKNCNRKFAITGIGPHTVGGCNPSYMAHTEADGKIVITADDIKAGTKFF